VIDDEAAVRDLMQRFLTKEGFRAVTASGGEEGLRWARELRPEAIVLDLVLPSMPGWDVARELRADDRTSHIPILATSGLDATKAEPKARAAGADRYMAKPFDGTTLVRHLRSLLDA